MQILRPLAVIAACAAFAACSNGATTRLTPQPSPTPSATPMPPPAGSIASFKTMKSIASTVDATNGDQNPYGLTIAPKTVGKEVAGDLIVCNFSDKANVNGNGTTIEDISPTSGAVTQLIQNSALKGCDAVAMAPNGNVWAADYSANNNPIISANGTINTTLAQGPWSGPWGQAFNTGTAPNPSFFVTNATNGTVIRINILAPTPPSTAPTFTFDTILTGLTYNNGAPGNILAPAGLTYEKASDSLYIVDSNANRVIKIAGASSAPPNTYAATGSTFNTPMVSTVYSGAPLASPISMAELTNGNLVIGNTVANSYGNNVLVELNPATQSIVSQINVDSNAAGALFGIAAATVNGTQFIYYNDDNNNTVNSLSP